MWSHRQRRQCFDERKSQLSHRNNVWLAAYYTLSRSWGKWRAGAGVRYEYDYTSTTMDGDNMKRTYHNVLPNAHIGVKPKAGLDFVFYYRRTLRRPSYYELRPTIYYSNSYMISTGNPELRPSVTDRIALTSNLKGFSWTVAYSHTSNTIQNILERLETGVMCDYPINIKHSHAWSLDLSYNYSNSWLNLSAQSVRLCLIQIILILHKRKQKTRHLPLFTSMLNSPWHRNICWAAMCFTARHGLQD